jgi:hypothetical protein
MLVGRGRRGVIRVIDAATWRKECLHAVVSFSSPGNAGAREGGSLRRADERHSEWRCPTDFEGPGPVLANANDASCAMAHGSSSNRATDVRTWAVVEGKGFSYLVDLSADCYRYALGTYHGPFTAFIN